MSDDQKRIIEIDGLKIEVDLREAKKIETYKVWDNVHVLVKEWSDKWEVYPGVITGFIDFEGLPTIQFAYLKNGDLVKGHVNKDTKDPVRIAPLDELDALLEREDVLAGYDRKIEAKERELADLKVQRRFFDQCFQRYFGDFIKERPESEVA